ncbi:MAG: DUF3662 and FHA domain-containing protein [Chloroflexi bacterium]|nr:DUF3662 and FHA domain-containing protein [Chloroflexota bacterium]
MLARFERLMEQAVEGSLRRVFPTSLQPIQLDKAAARAMEQAQVVGRRGREVANVYDLHIAPGDMTRFGEYRKTLADEVRGYLLEYAQARGLRPVGELSVQLIEDPAVRGGSVRASARFVGLSASERQDLEVAVEGTRRLRLAELAAAERARSSAPVPSELVVSDSAGVRFALEPAQEVVRIGRGVDNDIVLASTHVSRYHAQLRWVESSWLVYDLDSTNGTWVDDGKLQAGQPRALRAGGRLRLGDHELEVRAVRASDRGRR